MKKRVICALIIIAVISIGYCYHVQPQMEEYDSIIANVTKEYGYVYKKNKVISNLEMCRYTLISDNTDAKIIVEIYNSNESNDDVNITLTNKINSVDEKNISLLPHMGIASALIENISTKQLKKTMLVDFLKNGEIYYIDDSNNPVIAQKTLEGNGYLLDYSIVEEDGVLNFQLFEYFSISV